MSSSKKFLVLLLSVLFAVMAGCSVSYAAYYDNNTGDSWADAYVINTSADFKLMLETFNSQAKYYKLNADIDLTSETHWEPVGVFQGHFDGQGHIVRVNIDNRTDTYANASLFGSVSGDILNLNVTGTVRGAYQAAGIAGSVMYGSIENCTFEGTVEAINDVSSAAGIVVNAFGPVKNCTFSGTVSATSQGENSSSMAGGIAESAINIDNCQVLSGTSVSATSTGNGTSTAGGIAAFLLPKDQNTELMPGIITEVGIITNCTSNATVTATGGSLTSWAGGIVGLADETVTLSGNTWPTQYPQIGSSSSNGGTVPTPTPAPEQTTTELNVGVIAPVVLSDDVLERIANNINIGVSELHFLTSRDFSTAIPPEPTNAMRKEVSDNGYEFAAKLNTINVSEDGWYVFQVTVPDDLVGKSVNDLRLFYAEDSDFVNIASMKGVKTAFGFMPIINGITGAFEVSDFFGVELDTLPKQFLATMFLSAGKSLTVYVLRILLMLLGGCNLGLIGGGVVLVGGLIVFKFFRRH